MPTDAAAPLSDAHASDAPRTAWGWGLATIDVAAGVTLDTWYPALQLGSPADGEQAPGELAALQGADDPRGVRRRVVLTVIDLDAAPQSPADAYLRLHVLSHRLAAPNTLNLDGIFGVLQNVVWTDVGPVPVEGFELRRAALTRARGAAPVVLAVDKIPRMVDYVVPSGVRIGNADRVRLGAHLAPGTTVMHEGFVNYNDGTLGTSMVEGRISQGVVVGDGSDIGGGASIMGTLSGGGREVVSIGRRSLLGANAGLGIPLGDDCIVEAGLYVTAGTKVRVVRRGAAASDQPEIVKARDLAGHDGILFRRNSVSGAVEAVARTGAGIQLNSALHAN